jgi:hypothetical protein
MKNEPVAWAVWEGRPHDLFFTKEDADELCRLKGGDAKSVPLYTHPAKTLTDEEINKLWAESSEDGIAMQQGFTTQQHYFAHLILKKASEK